MAAAGLASSRTFAFESDMAPCPRKASFSSYLSATDDGLSLRLSIEFTGSNATGDSVSPGSSGKHKAGGEDDLLDIFGAEKYFSGDMDGDEPPAKPKKSSPAKEAALTAGLSTWRSTPSARSGTSGHTPSSLLKDGRKKPPRDPPKSRQTAGGKKLLGIFRCYCSDESGFEADGNAKATDDRKLGPKQVRPETRCDEEAGWRRTDIAGGRFGPVGDGFSAFLSPPNPMAVVGSLTVGERKGRRPSMDVFDNMPSPGKELSTTSSLGRSLAMSTVFTATAGTSGDSGVCSESSSDLFEIEHLTAGTGGVSAVPCYEPSEASIEWSIVTASAANFPTGWSDVEQSPPDARKATGRQQSQRPGGLLLGCASSKAVRIASNTYKVPENVGAADRLHHRHRSMDAMLAVTRYHAASPQPVDLQRRRAGRLLAVQGVIPAHPPHQRSPY